jgi:hypothetical protein
LGDSRIRCIAGWHQIQTGHTRKQRSKPIGQRSIGDIKRKPDQSRRVLVSQAAGLSPMVSDNCFVSPARLRSSVTVCHAECGA